MALIFHIPHAATLIPAQYRRDFLVSDEDLRFELLRMTDHFTDALFTQGCESPDRILRFPVSRLLVDPERFLEDDREPMAGRGMGVIYTRRHDLKPLRTSQARRQELLENFYFPHHAQLERLVRDSLAEIGKATILDCHSFPSRPLPYEPVQDPDRPEICIGTDAFHTPPQIRDALVGGYEALGYRVAVDTPFAGALVPLPFYEADPNVRSVMIEVRRDLYMNEASGERSPDFDLIALHTMRVVAQLRRLA